MKVTASSLFKENSKWLEDEMLGFWDGLFLGGQMFISGIVDLLVTLGDAGK